MTSFLDQQKFQFNYAWSYAVQMQILLESGQLYLSGSLLVRYNNLKDKIFQKMLVEIDDSLELYKLIDCCLAFDLEALAAQKARLEMALLNSEDS